MKTLKHITYKTLALVTIFAAPLLLTACNTMEGAGVDIQKAGKSLENSAENNKGSSHTCERCPHTKSRSTKAY